MEFIHTRRGMNREQSRCIGITCCALAHFCYTGHRQLLPGSIGSSQLIVALFWSAETLCRMFPHRQQDDEAILVFCHNHNEAV